MRRFLPLLILTILIVPTAFLIFGFYYQNKPKEAKIPNYPQGSVPVDQSPEKLSSESQDAKPVLRQVRGFYRSYRDNIVTLYTGSSNAEAVILPDSVAVCTPRYWTDIQGNQTDILQVYMDLSRITLDNYTQLGPNERSVQFADYQPKFDDNTHLIIFALQDRQSGVLSSKKIWIVGC